VSRSVSVPTRPGRLSIAVLYLFFAAEMARALTSPDRVDESGQYVAFFVLFMLLLTVVLWHPDLPPALRHAYLFVQCVLTLTLLSLNPKIDSITALFIILAYQAALFFSGPARWMWITALAFMIAVPLLIFLGPLRGLSAACLPMAVAIVLPAIVAANEEIERARLESERLVAELDKTHHQLQAHAPEVEKLAGLEERNRLARELHDSVSQTIFAITLTTRSAQMVLVRDPQQVRPQLQQLQALAQSALTQMRQLIAERRP
jgi:signal transduction histidine kinase